MGQLSAIAVSLSRSLTELIPLAVESVRLAFRSGMMATTVRDELEHSSESETWAMQTPRVRLGEANVLDMFHQEEVRTFNSFFCRLMVQHLTMIPGNTCSQKKLHQCFVWKRGHNSGTALNARQTRRLVEYKSEPPTAELPPKTAYLYSVSRTTPLHGRRY